MSSSELTMVYVLGGIIALIILINVIGFLFPPYKAPKNKPVTRPLTHRTEPSRPMAPIQKHSGTSAALDAELCKKYPLIDTAYKNGYRFVSYNPLVMELRE